MKDTLKQNLFYQQLGKNIREHRNRLKLSQDRLAKLVGLTRTSLTNIESGRQRPPLHVFCELLEYLKVDASELLPRRPAPPVAIDLQAMAGQQIRGENELAFIETGIGLKK